MSRNSASLVSNDNTRIVESPCDRILHGQKKAA